MPNQANPNDIIRRKQSGYNLFIKNDGFDYVSIWEAFRNGTLENVTTLKDGGNHRVYLITVGTRKLVLKIEVEIPKSLEGKVWRALQGPMHSSQMKLVNKAIRNGCTSVADIYFVAEKMKNFLSIESYNMQEFIEGERLGHSGPYTDMLPALVDAVEDLHKHNLVWGDVHEFNVVVNKENKIKLIDLSWHGLIWTGKGKDYQAVRDYYGVLLPKPNLMRLIAAKYIDAKRSFKYFRKRLKAKIFPS